MTRPTTIITVLAILVLCSSALAMDGSGTETDPYIITNVDELQAMRDDLSAHYQLGNDMDATATAGWFEGAGFEPVGTDSNSFTGVFDGKGYVITGLYINRPSDLYVGLFGFVRGAEIRNVGLADVDITGHGAMGTLVGGGRESVIFSAWSSGTVRGTGILQYPLGGLIGTSSEYCHISQCYSSANVSAITSSSPGNRTGGLAGINTKGSIIIDGYATGNVSGKYKVGGLVGDNIYGSWGGYIKRCYSVGKVTGDGGGLVGYNWMSGVTYDSYWDVETSGKDTSYGGTPKTTEEMMQQATFVNWDFDQVWNIIENVTYPFFGEPPLLIGLEIAGPNEVAENHQTRYSAIAIYDNNTTADVTNLAVWSVEPNLIASIEAGLLATDKIFEPHAVTITAEYTEADITAEDAKEVGIFAICPEGAALEFDGADDYINLGNDASLKPSLPVTLTAWIKFMSSSSQMDTILLDTLDGYNRYYGVWLNLGGNGDWINCGYGDGGIAGQGSRRNKKATVTLSEGVWYHVTATINGPTDMSLYVNGLDAGGTYLGTGGSLTYSISGNASIGARQNDRVGSEYYFHGCIDEVVIYDRALSVEQIQILMHTRPDAGEPNLVGYWNFDEGEGQVAYDLSPNANHGQLGSDPNADDSDPAWVDSDAPTGICTPEGLVKRNVNDALEIKLNILQQIEEALLMEDASVNILDDLFDEAQYGHLDKRDIIKAKQEIHSAIQGEEQAIDSLERSAGDLEDSLEALSGDDSSPETPAQGTSPPGRQSKTLTKPAPSDIRKPSRK